MSNVIDVEVTVAEVIVGGLGIVFRVKVLLTVVFATATVKV